MRKLMKAAFFAAMLLAISATAALAIDTTARITHIDTDEGIIRLNNGDSLVVPEGFDISTLGVAILVTAIYDDTGEEPYRATALAPAGLAQGSAATIATYTGEQADRGEDAYEDNCVGCHGATLGGEGEAPGLIGSGFRTRWFSDTAAMFFAYISASMPQQAPGTLEPQTYADIMAYILQRNGYPAGEAELPANAEILQTLTIPERPE